MNAGEIQILVVDDDPALLAVLEAGLRGEPERCVVAVDSIDAALGQLDARRYDLVVTDYSLEESKRTGLDILRHARAQDHRPEVIIITAFASLKVTLDSIKLGAYDFLTKPFQLEELQLVVRNAARCIRLDRCNRDLHGQVAHLVNELSEIADGYDELLGRFRDLAARIGATPNPADTGPLGVGSLSERQKQELRRRQIHEQLSAYVRMGESIQDRIAREQQRIESLVDDGLLPPDARPTVGPGKVAS